MKPRGKTGEVNRSSAAKTKSFGKVCVELLTPADTVCRLRESEVKTLIGETKMASYESVVNEGGEGFSPAQNAAEKAQFTTVTDMQVELHRLELALDRSSDELHRAENGPLLSDSDRAELVEKIKAERRIMKDRKSELKDAIRKAGK
jgi:hypothetical protein